MSAAYTYTTLIAEIRTYLANETGAKLAAELPNLVALAELKVLRDLDITLFDAIESLVITATNAFPGKPTGYLATLALRMSPTARPLKLRSREYILEYWPDTSATGTPCYYCDYSLTQFKVAPTPAESTTGYIDFIKRPDGLSVSNANTWLGDNVGDLLLYAALGAAEQWDMNDERLPTWKAEYGERLAAARKEFAALIRKA